MKKVNMYDSVYLTTKEGLIATDRVRFFVPLSAIDSDGRILTAGIGNNLVEKERGYTFILDEYAANQFEKFIVIIENGVPELYVKDGEEIENNKTPEEIEIEKLQQELALKQAELNAKLAPQ